MSLIGKLEQLNLALVLQGIETYAKTGLLVVKQDTHWVELYFRDGRLMCIGPVQPNASLADRLLKAGVISAQVLQDTLAAIGPAEPGETRIALTLMDMSFVSHDALRTWAAQEASDVLQVLLTWPGGDLFFEDGMQPPADRLLVALSPAALLPAPAAPAAAPAASPAPPPPAQQATPAEEAAPRAQQPQPPAETAPPQKMSASQLLAGAPAAPPPASPISFAQSASPVPSGNLPGAGAGQASTSLTPAQRVNGTPVPMRIDTSFMRPEMVLLPVDLSVLRQHNPRLAITPEQWRILTRVDGQNSLQAMCRDLAIPAEYVRQLAGELISLGLVRVSMPAQRAQIRELSPLGQDPLAAGYVAPGYASSPAQPWMAMGPHTDTLPPVFKASLPFETNSQWGNGGNGATFVPGRGWVATPQPMQPVQADRIPLVGQNVYAGVGRSR